MRVHFIAIGGSAMHNLAIALHQKGFVVTGSDDVLFEPSVSRLAKHGLLPKNQGWFPENIDAHIDAVILGMHARIDNPELLKAQQLGLKIYSYPEYIYEQSKTKTRVVIGGSHGKTTITSMVMHVLKCAGLDFDYLVGAQLEGFETMVKLTDSAPVIVIEGDEYLASPIDRRPKFHLYKANLAVISGIAWDHVNVFPTFDLYKAQFSIFIDTIQSGGKLVYCETESALKAVVDANHRLDITKTPYQLPAHEVIDHITNVVIGGDRVALEIFGDHNLLNAEAARSICDDLGIDAKRFYGYLASFKGAARRLELLATTVRSNIYKDFAHSPSKLSATIQAVKSQFADRKLVAVIELHTFSSLNAGFLKEYAHTMDMADTAIVFTDEKTFEQKRMEPYTAADVKAAFKRDDILVFNKPDLLTNYLLDTEIENTNMLFMSSGNFGGIDIAELAKKILQSPAKAHTLI